MKTHFLSLLEDLLTLGEGVGLGTGGGHGKDRSTLAGIGGGKGGGRAEDKSSNSELHGWFGFERRRYDVDVPLVAVARRKNLKFNMRQD